MMSSVSNARGVPLTTEAISQISPLTPDGRPRRGLAAPALLLGVIGVVFGDIGTSPLYTLRAVFTAHDGIMLDEVDVLGAVSMVIWCLIIIVTVGYVGIITRADNQGEGGIFALAALISGRLGAKAKLSAVTLTLAVIGAALFIGDSVITPAISVMSATEGLNALNGDLSAWVLPIAICVLTLLFLVQSRGTSRIGRAFGPIMVLWFCSIAALGAPGVIADPAILRALSPTYALDFAIERPVVAFVALGAVVLAVTGAEALYADLGHFGRRPIVIAWLSLILPALVLVYLGQGALLLRDPAAIESPFFSLAPAQLRLPLVVLATLATVIASQAVISGAFSVVRQAVRLSLLPRLRVVQTSPEHGGQVYLPIVNALLFTGVLVLVLAFRSSDRLASAYGLAVTGTLLLELTLFLVYARTVRCWRWWRIVAMAVGVGVLEVLLFAGNVVKIPSGGWLPAAIAAALVAVMLTWQRGARVVFGQRRRMEGPIEPFVERLHERDIRRVPGVAVYPHGDPQTVPLALRSAVQFSHTLHEHVVIITMKNLRVPHVPIEQRVVIDSLGREDDGIVQVIYRLGFNDSQNVPAALRLAVGRSPELHLDPEQAIYVLSVFRIEPGASSGMSRWRRGLFRWLERLSANRTQVFHLPPERTVVMGAEAVL